MPSEIDQSVIGRMVYKEKKRKNSREKSKSKITSAIHSSSYDQNKKKKNGKEKSHDDQKKDEGEQKRICTYADRKSSSHNLKDRLENFRYSVKIPSLDISTLEGSRILCSDEPIAKDAANAAVKEYNRQNPNRCVRLLKILGGKCVSCPGFPVSLTLKVQEINKIADLEHLQSFLIETCVYSYTFKVKYVAKLE